MSSPTGGLTISSNDISGHLQQQQHRMHLSKSVSQQQPLEQKGNNGRRRYHSWTRRYRRKEGFSPASAEDNFQGRSNVVNGETYICFAKDNSWFQGSIVSQHNHHYKVMGRKQLGIPDAADGSSRDFLDLGGSGNNSSNNNSGGGSNSGSGQTTPFSRSNQTSECDSLDSELVNDVMEKLSMEEDDLFMEEEDMSLAAAATDLYQIIVTDFETGLDYRADNVRVAKKSSSDCRVSSPVFKFRSSQAFKGAIADKILIEQMGPSFVDQHLIVFRGDVRFVYQDRQCYPVTVEATQWCL